MNSKPYKRTKILDPDTDIIEYKLLNEFKSHQCYEKPADTQTLICRKCNTDLFKVGQGDYFNAIKCINCNYEVPIYHG